jgi:flagella basal body P-ring formation protein FlgA
MIVTKLPRTRILIKSAIFIIVTIAIIAPSVYAQNINTDSKTRLVENIKNWVASQERVDISYIEVQANDRRFIVPDCTEDFEVNFAFGAKSNVQVKCESKDWTAVLRIQIRAETEVLIYGRTLTQGEVISAQDLELSKEGFFLGSNTLTSVAEAEGRLLKISVNKGQIVRLSQFDEALTLFVTNRDVKKGQALTASIVDTLITPASETSFDQRFDFATTLNSVITKDLAAGTVLTKNDFIVSAQAVVVVDLMERGSRFDPSNSRVESVVIKLPSDAITTPSQLDRAIAKRRLTPGAIIRFSDITIQPHVIADTSTTLQLTKPQFTLTIEVMAIEDGYIGDRIRVRNQESGEIIYATVIDVGLVEIVQ